jgi:hypothetical protein
MPFDRHTVYAATEIGVFRTTNDGQSWHPFQTGLPVVQCKDIKFVVDDTLAGKHKLVVATYGRGLWTREVSGPSIIYVDKTHVGSEDGSFEHPYNTVAEAVSVAPTGAIIGIRSNTYKEPQTIGKDLTLATYAATTLIK